MDTPAGHSDSRPLYTLDEAATFLRARPEQLRQWIHDPTSEPTTPPSAHTRTNADTLTWAQFITAALLAEYRISETQTPTVQLLLENIRQLTGHPHPFAKDLLANPEGIATVWEAQKNTAAHPSLWLVWNPRRKTRPSPQAERFLNKITYDTEGKASLWRPWPAHRRIVMEPATGLGMPHINKIRTAVLAHLPNPRSASRAFRRWVTEDDIRHAVMFESRLRNRS